MATLGGTHKQAKKWQQQQQAAAGLTHIYVYSSITSGSRPANNTEQDHQDHVTGATPHNACRKCLCRHPPGLSLGLTSCREA